MIINLDTRGADTRYFRHGNIIGPLTFRGADAPQYIPAKIGIVATSGFACVATLVLMLYYAWENKRRDQLHVEHQENSEFFDLTDKENLEFCVSCSVLKRFKDAWLTRFSTVSSMSSFGQGCCLCRGSPHFHSESCNFGLFTSTWVRGSACSVSMEGGIQLFQSQWIPRLGNCQSCKSHVRFCNRKVFLCLPHLCIVSTTISSEQAASPQSPESSLGHGC